MDSYAGGVSSEPGTGVQTCYSNQPGASYSGSTHLIISALGGACLGSLNSEVGLSMWHVGIV